MIPELFIIVEGKIQYSLLSIMLAVFVEPFIKLRNLYVIFKLIKVPYQINAKFVK